jgi:NAD(P)-dependent dehydrogenase (short-subunit alcohol dehydrogenase family)
MRLEGKLAVVTGGGRGIGREAARLFAREGAHVVVADIDLDSATATVDLIRSEAGSAEAVQVDVTVASSVEAMVRRAEKTLGGLNVMFNNAGIMLPDDRGAEDTSLDVWHRTIAVNLTGVFLCCKYGLPAMLRTGGGAIVNMGSMVAHIGSAVPQIAYVATKGGVVAMTREIAIQYARRNIRANALCPGPVRTELISALVATPEQHERRRVHLPLGRFADPAEIAQVALFLASDESSYVTGMSYLVDGGVTAAYVTPE